MPVLAAPILRGSKLQPSAKVATLVEQLVMLGKPACVLAHILGPVCIVSAFFQDGAKLSLRRRDFEPLHELSVSAPCHEARFFGGGPE